MNRYKDAQPEDTVQTIQALLASVGLTMDGRVNNYGNRLFSVSIADKDTGFSTNGKGADAQLCLASAYGEAMERLQNHFGFSDFASSAVDAYLGFTRHPEEKLESFDSVLQQHPFIKADMDLCCEQDADATDYWKTRLGEQLIMLPYYHVETGEPAFLPDQLIANMAGSNGLCAGNTPQEALCEGMHELCERYAKACILTEEYCLPDIPRTFIEETCPQQAEVIRLIEATIPHCHVAVKDASLGRGLPVACIIFIDRNRGRYHIKFGAHLSFPIALERCLTELFQGFDHEKTNEMDKALTTWDAQSRALRFHAENRISMERSDVGAIPDRILLSSPDWEFKPWGLDGFDNKTGLRILTDLLASIGGNVFIRDTGFLGFPAYRIYVPGVSVGFAKHGPQMSHRVRVFRQFDRNVGFAIFAYERGDLATAAEYLSKTNKRSYLCAAQELQLRIEGVPENERDQLLAQFFGSAVAVHAAHCWRSNDVAAALLEQRRQAITRMQSEQGETDDKHQAIAALRCKLKERMASRPIDQQRLANLYR